MGDFIPKINEKFKFENRIYIFSGSLEFSRNSKNVFFLGISSRYYLPLKIKMSKKSLFLSEIKFWFGDSNFQKFLNCDSKVMNRVLFSKVFLRNKVWNQLIFSSVNRCLASFRCAFNHKRMDLIHFELTSLQVLKNLISKTPILVFNCCRDATEVNN